MNRHERRAAEAPPSAPVPVGRIALVCLAIAAMSLASISDWLALKAALILLALAAAFIDLPAAFVLMAAVPAGLHIVVLAHIYGLDIGLSAGVIAWTTLVSIPALLVASVIV